MTSSDARPPDEAPDISCGHRHPVSEPRSLSPDSIVSSWWRRFPSVGGSACVSFSLPLPGSAPGGGTASPRAAGGGASAVAAEKVPCGVDTWLLLLCTWRRGAGPRTVAGPAGMPAATETLVSPHAGRLDGAVPGLLARSAFCPGCLCSLRVAKTRGRAERPSEAGASFPLLVKSGERVGPGRETDGVRMPSAARGAQPPVPRRTPAVGYVPSTPPGQAAALSRGAE